MKKTAVLLLAAGMSRRLGQPKQLVKKAGKTLLRHTAEIISESDIGDLFVVLGAEVDVMRDELQNVDYQEVINADFASGMSSSIVAGVRAASAYAGVMICLTDQIFLHSDILKEVVRLGENRVQPVRCVYEKGAGPPVYFPARFFPELLKLKDDTGAKPVIKKYSGEVLSVDFRKGHIDIDTPADLSHLV